MQVRLLFVLAVVFLYGCGSNPVSPVHSTTSQIVDDPPLNTVVERGLGERLVAKGIRTVGDALTISAPTQFGKAEGEPALMTCAFTIQPISVFKNGVYNRKGESAECYGPLMLSVTHHDGTTNALSCPGNMYAGNVCRRSDGTFFAVSSSGDKQEQKQDFQHLRVEEKAVTTGTNFVQELIYNGRSGDTIRLVYREFSGDMIRPAFNQDVQYDLSKSDEVGFKSLRMRVLEASNTSIKYILQRNF